MSKIKPAQNGKSWRAAAFATIATLLLFSTAPALAHSFLVDANPSSKDHVEAMPKAVKLKFGAGVEPAYSTLSIETSDGKVLAKGAVGKPETPRELTLDAPADLAPGRYVIRYRVLSQDGHIVEGNYEFFLDAKK
ncbi:copper resistance CopC family protein [Methylocystis bryophila]|uniref:Copper resistance protein CopC n=1 Tax=Methylocystis bryophila TaxID=655015 RepID=A0A1W6MYZ3_9HYPH|nr:copper resistance CopC family protein [Methylocystis bryophila]ARN82783.1 copper resistance protein CopC [Methylocystis bryophila]BDV39026.1 hypothetical protein DSM21852_22790 [Methylocystis bryophila]